MESLLKMNAFDKARFTEFLGLPPINYAFELPLVAPFRQPPLMNHPPLVSSCRRMEYADQEAPAELNEGVYELAIGKLFDVLCTIRGVSSQCCEFFVCQEHLDLFAEFSGSFLHHLDRLRKGEDAPAWSEDLAEKFPCMDFLLTRDMHVLAGSIDRYVRKCMANNA